MGAKEPMWARSSKRKHEAMEPSATEQARARESKCGYKTANAFARDQTRARRSSIGHIGANMGKGQCRKQSWASGRKHGREGASAVAKEQNADTKEQALVWEKDGAF